MFRKIHQETEVLKDMLVENGHEKTLPENLVKDYNAKKKNNDSCSYTNLKKISWVPNVGPKIRKQYKQVNKDLRNKNILGKKTCSYYLIAILECISWITNAMLDILVNQRKK